MRRHYPFFFVLVFPTLYEEKLREGEEAMATIEPQSQVGSFTTPSL